MPWKNVISTQRETLPQSAPTYWDSWRVKMIFLFELLRKKGKQEKRSIRSTTSGYFNCDQFKLRDDINEEILK